MATLLPVCQLGKRKGRQKKVRGSFIFLSLVSNRKGKKGKEMIGQGPPHSRLIISGTEKKSVRIHDAVSSAPRPGAGCGTSAGKRKGKRGKRRGGEKERL